MQDDTSAAQVRVATAGWAVPRAVADAFPGEGTGLERYAARLNAAEINSTFYRSHRPSTYARWAATTPADFRFSIKLPRGISHEARLVDAQDLIAKFCDEAGHLGAKLGPLLVQLPPSLAFDPGPHDRFFDDLRKHWTGQVVCEPRHASWLGEEADAMLVHWRVSRVAADPARAPLAAQPGGWTGLVYWRLHGSPRTYWSSYDDAALAMLAGRLSAAESRETWCVFDNTASGAAAANALTLLAML